MAEDGEPPESIVSFVRNLFGYTKHEEDDAAEPPPRRRLHSDLLELYAALGPNMHPCMYTCTCASV